MMDDEVVRYLLAQTSAEDPFNFDADPDPGSARKKMDPDPGHFFKIY